MSLSAKGFSLSAAFLRSGVPPGRRGAGIGKRSPEAMLLHGVMIYQKDELANILIISPVYTMLNFWYGTDKIDTRTLGKIVKLILWNLRLHH